jgi:hypothetical protein
MKGLSTQLSQAVFHLSEVGMKKAAETSRFR